MREGDPRSARILAEAPNQNCQVLTCPSFILQSFDHGGRQDGHRQLVRVVGQRQGFTFVETVF